jgi:hypothetical protein
MILQVFERKFGFYCENAIARYMIQGCAQNDGLQADLQKSSKLVFRAKKFSDGALAVKNRHIIRGSAECS